MKIPKINLVLIEGRGGFDVGRFSLSSSSMSPSSTLASVSRLPSAPNDSDDEKLKFERSTDDLQS